VFQTRAAIQILFHLSSWLDLINYRIEFISVLVARKTVLLADY
jgi:hypothetical protein